MQTKNTNQIINFENCTTLSFTKQKYDKMQFSASVSAHKNLLQIIRHLKQKA